MKKATVANRQMTDITKSISKDIPYLNATIQTIAMINDTMAAVGLSFIF
jgi:hexokinase